jgi:hypothetical protein
MKKSHLKLRKLFQLSMQIREIRVVQFPRSVMNREKFYPKSYITKTPRLISRGFSIYRGTCYVNA